MKRAVFLVAAFLAPAVLFAQGFAGTKTGGEYSASPAVTVGAGSGASSGPGLGSLVQMLIALGVVIFLLKAVLPKVAGKFTKKLVSTRTGGITVEESAQFAGGSLYVVSARGKSLLLSVTSHGVRTLAELPTLPEAKPEPFEVALADAQLHRVTPSEAIHSDADVLAALNRLTSLTDHAAH